MPKSVDDLVAEAVERLRKRLSERNVGGIQPLALQTAEDQRAIASDDLHAIGYPALVEALSFYADPANHRVQIRRIGKDRYGIAGGLVGEDKGERALAVLGGEVPSTGRGEMERLRKAVNGYLSAQNSAGFNDAPDSGQDELCAEARAHLCRTVYALNEAAAVDGETTGDGDV
jgi:hypothetical protein